MKFPFFHHNKKADSSQKPENNTPLPDNNTFFPDSSVFRHTAININTCITQLEAGQENQLAVIYPMILSRDADLADTAAGAIHTYMESLGTPRIIKLSRLFRQYTSMEWYIDWVGIALPDIRENIRDRNAYLDVLRLGTFHPNGYFREKCMWALKDDEASFLYIALRLNDWVKPVRDAAYRILSGGLPSAKPDTAIAMLPYISQAKKGERYVYSQLQEIEHAVTEKILLHLDEISLDKIKDYIPDTKRFLYKILIRPDVLSKADANLLLRLEINGNEKALIISRILEHYACSEEEINNYIKNKSPIVRKKALETIYERLGSAWDGLEVHLLDTAKGIRSDVCYILQKHTDFDILSFYKSRLHTPQEAVAILGIGENGTKKDAPVLTEYLHADTPKLIKYAMKSLSSLGASDLEDIYWNYLNDKDVTISKTAYDAIRRSDIHYGAETLYQAYQNCNNAYTQKYLFYLLIQEPSWERLPYLLLLYKPYDTLSDHEEKRIQMMLLRALSFRGVYACISKRLAVFIREVINMPALKIPDGIKKAVLFDLEHIEIR